MRLQSVLAIAFLMSTTVACDDVSLDGSASDLALDESALEGTTAGLPRPAEYFLAERDTRLCPAPLCGGYFVSAPNRPTIECPDGTVQARCHVGAIDLAPLELGAFDEQRFRSAIDAGRTVIRGQLTAESAGPFVPAGTLIAGEGWLAADDNAVRGSFMHLRDTGRVCISEPCFHYEFASLNLSNSRLASRLSWPGFGNPESMAQLRGEGVLVTAMVLYPPTIGGIPAGINLVASHHFLRVDHRPISPIDSPVVTQ